MSENKETLRPVSLSRAVRKGFRAAYDNLGYVVFVTFVSFLVAAVLSSLIVLMVKTIHPGMAGVWAVVLVAFISYLWAVGVYYFVNKSVFYEHPVLSDTWRGIKAVLIPAAALFVVDAMISTILIADAWFFLNVLVAKKSLIFAGIGALFAYAALVWLMMLMYHLPLLIAQTKMESGPGVKVIVRKSFLLVADNPSFTVGLFLVIIAFTVLCVLPALIGMAVLFLGVTAFLTTHALRELFIKYKIVEDEPDVVEERAWSLPDSWRKREDHNDKNSDDTGGRTDG